MHADASTTPEGGVSVGPQDSGAGSDVFVCAAPSAVCAGACVDTQADPANCGGCGATCGGTCQNAHCVVQLAQRSSSRRIRSPDRSRRSIPS
jgi:hypothetical protein